MPAPAPTTEQDGRLVCAILAAQMAALRERLADPAVFERLMECVETLGALAAALPEGGAAAAAASRLDRALDELVFDHAQHQDLARQTAGLVARALEMLAGGDAARPALSLAGLKALYVTADQRRLHDAVVAAQSSGSAAEGP